MSCVKGAVKTKAPQICESLFGTLNDHQIFLIREAWNHIAYLERALKTLDGQIDQILEDYKEEMDLIQTVPGIQKTTAATILAEIGSDMSQFPTAAHLSSWAGLSPGNHESAGKKKSQYSEGKSTHQGSTVRGCLGCFTISKDMVIQEVLETLCSNRKKKSDYSRCSQDDCKPPLHVVS